MNPRVGDTNLDFIKIIHDPLTVAGGRGSGNYGHAGRPGKVGGSASEGNLRTDNNPSDRAKRAVEAHNPFTKEKESWATKNEMEVIGMTGGEGTDDNRPLDVVIKRGRKVHGMEVKTMLDNKASKITMRKDALRRKEEWAEENNATLHTVVIDDRDAFGRKDLYSGHRIYYMRGVGSFRIGSMVRVRDAAHLRELMK